MIEKIAFVADSCSDLPQKILDRENVFMIPLVVDCGGKEYLDRIEITATKVYEQLKQGVSMKTSLPTGASVEKTLKTILEQGYHKAVVITMSSEISGTWNLLRLICSECEQLECIVFDSKMASLAEGALLIELMDEVESGSVSWENIPQRLETLKNQTFPFFGIDSLEYLQKSGRIGKVTATAGNLLNIMPILTFNEEGILESIEKVRGTKRRVHHLANRAISKVKENQRYRLYFADDGSGKAIGELQDRVLAELGNPIEILVTTLGCPLAAHIGPGLIGVCVQILD